MSDFTAVSALFAGTDIFVIPTFQRPYSWEEAQWDDLLRDIRFATARFKTNRHATHYFGAIHTIKVEPEDHLFKTFTDQENHDIKLLKESDFVLNGKSYNRVVTDVKLLNNRNFVVPETSGKAEELVDQGR